MFLFWLKLSCNITHKVHNIECIDPNKPSIILSRHESTWEALAFHAIFPMQINIVKKELKLIPFFGFILGTIESIFIDRKQPFKAIKHIKKKGTQAIKNGFWLIIFPGGTRVPPEEPTEVQSGGLMFAKQVSVPVYLVAHNAGKTWPKGTFIKQPGIIDVYIKPLNNIENKNLKTIGSEAQAWFQTPYQPNPKEIQNNVNA
ncbi:MAG: 1-acyl-sn-glycerol-3-phosphate acyltransferase [Thiomicrorhabdus sp.]|nr:1-acyl-sn-glycerol-3-phosphate acyltransferase [Thiomicrorhabdus sp.]